MKRVLSILLVLVTLFSIMPLTVLAATGTDGLVYELSTDGTYYIVSGRSSYSATQIVIPSEYNELPVKEIDEEAFYQCYNLTSVTIGNSVTTIGDSAFFACHDLRSVAFGDSVTTIGDSAFFECHDLTSVTIPDSVTTIGRYAFSSCSNLTSITIPNSVTAIGNYAFYYCYDLTSVTIPDSVTAIGAYAFYGCDSLTSITIPDSVTAIGEGAFSGCDALETIVVEDGNTVYHSAGNCIIETATKTLVSGCKNSVIPSDGSVTTIGDHAFSGCDNLTSITIPDAVTAIGEGAFSYCYSLTSVTIPNSLTTVGDSAFYCCEGLTSITIPDSVTTIGDRAFSNCDSLTSVTIPDSVTTIGEYAFSFCKNLIDIYCEGPWALDDWDSSWDNDCDATVYWGYGTAEPANGLIFEPSTDKTYCIVTGYNGHATGVVIPSSYNGLPVKKIKWYAFSNDGIIRSVAIPDSVIEIGHWAFSDCANLTDIYCEAKSKPSGWSTGYDEWDGFPLHWNANCNANIHWGCSIDMPPEGVLGTEGLIYKLSEDETYYMILAYIGTSTEVIIPSIYYNRTPVKEISKSAFSNCSNLTSIIIPDSVTAIGNYAFSNCSNLTSITIPDSVTTIGDYVFKGCGRLTDICCEAESQPNGWSESWKSGCDANVDWKDIVEITTQPKSVSVQSGKTAKVTFSATGDGLTYKWYFKNKGDSEFSLATSFAGNTYSAEMNSTHAGRQVYCVIADKYGNSVTTNTVTLGMAVKITTQPKTVAVQSGKTAKVTVSASGDGLTYQWYFKNKGESKFSLTTSFTGNTYSAEMNSTRAGRQVYCVITDEYGNSVTTNTVTLGMTVKITTQPTNVVVQTGKTAKVTVKASGDGLMYKWYFKNKGASSFSLTTTFTGNTYSAEMNSTRAGRQVYCVITDKYGNTVKTNTVTLGMAVKITTQPKTVAVQSGKTAKVTVKASGEGLTYKWYFKNKGDSKFSLTTSFTGNTYSAEMNSTRAGRQVYCVITDKYGDSVKTNTVTLGMAVKITTQPKTVAVQTGKTAKVTVKASGEGLTYKWYFKNKSDSKFSLTTSFTGNTYSAEMNSTRAGRQVYCIITDKYGNKVQTNTVTLGMTVKITQQPKNVVAHIGKTAKVTVTAIGDGLTYKWYYKDKGASSYVYTSSFKGNSYSISMTSERAGRRVYCVITDKYGNTVTTNSVALTKTDHSWKAATCNSPKKCKICGVESGSNLSHVIVNGKCKKCGMSKTDIEIATALKNIERYTGYIEINKALIANEYDLFRITGDLQWYVDAHKHMLEICDYLQKVKAEFKGISTNHHTVKAIPTDCQKLILEMPTPPVSLTFSSVSSYISKCKTFAQKADRIFVGYEQLCETFGVK